MATCIVALVLAALLGCQNALGDCGQIPVGAIGWWAGDGNANNVLGTNNGTLQGGATANVVGRVGLAFNFDGTNNFVQIPDSPILRPTNLTIEAWVRFNDLNTPGNAEVGRQYLVFKQNSASADFEGYDLSKTRNANGDVFEFRVSNASGQSVAATASTLIATGQWYHVAAVRAPNFLQIYVNGQLQRQTNVTFAQNYGTQPLYFGSSGQAFWDRKFRGTLDEVTLYSRALASNEVAAIYNAGVDGKCKAVIITTPPQNQNVQAGGSAGFSVSATGFGTLRYRWMFNGETIAGATNTSFSLTNAQVSNAGNYAVAVSNTLSVVTSAPAVLSISTPPVITNAPQSQTVIVGSSVIFSVGASGTAPLSFQWRKGGVALNGQTAAGFALPNVTTNDAGNYDVVVTNLVGAVTSAPPAVLTVNVPPFITLAPQSQSTTVGSNVNLSVIASGTLPLSYQWRKVGIPLAGQTSSTLSLLNVTTGDAANYDVVVTNVAGSVTSAPPATLTVNVPPFITSPPVSQTVVLGTNVNLNVIAGGTMPLTYQWRKAGSPLPSQTSATLQFANVTTNDAGSYDVVISNVAGAITSTPPVTLTVNVPPFITSPPQNQTVTAGSNVTFTVVASGTVPLSYQWRKGSSILNGQTGPSLALVSITTNDAGNYDVIVSNIAGVITSAPPATLVVNVPPFITSPPQNQTVTAGSNVNFSVVAGGTAPLSYQWRKGSAILNGQTGPSLTLSSVTPNDAGNYDVIVANTAGVITSAPPATLTVNVLPFITNAPQSQTVTENTTVALTVGAGGSAPLSYQWRKGGLLLGGQVGPTVNFANVAMADAGSYDVVVSNVAGSVTSAPPAILTVVAGASGYPTITNQPESQTTVMGADVTFVVGVYGSSPLRYQWRKEGVDLVNRTNATLSVSSVLAADAGSYDVVVTNLVGAVTSAPPAALIVIPPLVSKPSITNQPQSQRVGIGGSVNLFVGVDGTAPLNFQWRKNGSPIAGQTAGTLLLSNVSSGDDGNYDVVVTNIGGSVTSAVASLSVKLVVDPELEKALVCAVTNQSGSLTPTDLQSLVHLSVRNRGITNLFGLQFATGLTSLDASQNRISDLTPLQGLAQLSSLELDDNGGELTTLSPLSGLSNLNCLVLGQIYANSYTPLSGLSNLTSLVLRKGNVGNLNFLQNLRQLSSLSLPQNNIRNTTPLRGLTNLSRLDLRWNPAITNYSALQSGCTNLVSLQLGGNATTSIPPLQSMSRLKLLDLAENNISTLDPLVSLTNLNYLVLNRNPVSDYSPLATLSNLVYLELSGNAISNITFLSSLKKLQYADLSYNHIADLTSFSSFTNLQGLVLAGNHVNGFSPLAGISSLSNLWVQNCSITNVAFLSSLQRLGHLNLDGNFVSDITPVLGMTNLTGLGLSYNPATNISAVSSLKNLTGLRLEGNAMTEIGSLTNLFRLNYLSLSQNRLTNATQLATLTNLQNHYLRRNRLRDISYLQYLPRSTSLDLGLNLLSPANGSPELAVIEGLRCQPTIVPQCNCAVPLNAPTGRGVDLSDLNQHSVPGIAVPEKWFIPRNSTSVIAFSVWYDLNPDDPLPVVASTSNPGLIESNGLALGLSNYSRTLTVSPKPGQIGNVNVMLAVVNEAGLATNASIQISVLVPVEVEDMLPPGVPLDPELEIAFRQASGKYEGDLTSVDLLNITTLTLNGSDFTGFSGWQWLTNLTTLSLTGAGDLDFLTNLTQLTALHLYEPDTAELAKLSLIANLTELELTGLTISNLSFITPLTTLKSLGISRTRVANLTPLAGLTNLTQVRLQQNMLTNILALYTLPHLSSVDVRYNLLAMSSGALPFAVILGLEGRGVDVDYLPQRAAPVIQIANAWNVSANRTSSMTFSILENGELAYDLSGVGSYSSNPVLLPDSNHHVALDTSSSVVEWALTISPVVSQVGSTLVTITATNDVGLNSSTSLWITVSQPLPLDSEFFGMTDLTWQLSGEVNWFGQTTISTAGFPAAQSGAINHGQTSVLESTLIGPGTLRYWWKVSSELDYDWLIFESQDATNQISGEVDWEEQVVAIGPRTQTVRWRYSKDLNAASGMDAGWVAHVTFVPATWIDLVEAPTNAHCHIALYGVPGQEYAIEISTNAVDWVQLGAVLSTNRITPFVDTAATNAMRFYRARAMLESPVMGLSGQTNTGFDLTWPGIGVLQASPTPSGPWQEMGGISPFHVSTEAASAQFFRVKVVGD